MQNRLHRLQATLRPLRLVRQEHPADRHPHATWLVDQPTSAGSQAPGRFKRRGVRDMWEPYAWAHQEAKRASETTRTRRLGAERCTERGVRHQREL